MRFKHREAKLLSSVKLVSNDGMRQFVFLLTRSVVNMESDGVDIC